MQKYINITIMMILITSCSCFRKDNNIILNENVSYTLDSMAKKFLIDPESIDKNYILDENKIGYASGLLLLYYPLKELKLFPLFSSEWENIHFTNIGFEKTYNNEYKTEKYFFITNGQNSKNDVTITFIYHEDHWRIYIIDTH